jgi:hypothetical protein
MGCDIHVYLEKYTSVNGEYKWVNVDHWQLNPDFGSHENEREYDLIPFYWGRNYDLFSILAEVRGSYDPIDDPRGLPEDVTDATRKEFERWGQDAHTPSHYTLKELKDYLYNNSEDDELTETLKRFVEPMENRFREEFWITNDDEKRYTVKENAFRVVFWFDN